MTTKKKTKKTKKFTVTVKDEATTAAPATTQASADATTQDAKANASVQSVSLSNNTPKVDDTITATVSFKTSGDAATFAWYTVDATSNAATLIEGATTSSLKVTEAMVGKYIKVQATGSDNSSAAATTTSVVSAGDAQELAITAKQIGASKILVTANKAITKEDTVTITRGESTIGNSFVPSGDGLSIVITTEVKIGAAEYTVKVTPKDTKKAAATAKFTGVAAILEKIDFAGDELVLTSADFKECRVKIFGYDNFGDQVSLSSLTPYTSKGEVKYEASTNEIVISQTGTGILFQTGESITVTAIYQDGTTVKQVAKALKVSEVSAIKSITLGELSTTKAELKGKAVTLNNMKTGTYYKTIEAVDQYGNKLTAKDLTARLNSAENPTGSLFIAGSLAAGSYVYITGFDTLDGKVIAKYNLGALGMPGTQLFTFTAVGGYSATDSITIVDNPYIADLTIDVPELYGTKTSVLTLSAKDQNGDAVNLYDFVKESEVVDPKTADSVDFKFADVNGTTKSNTKITIPKGIVLTVDKDTVAKTVKFSVTPVSNPEAANVTRVIVVQTAAPKVSNVQCAIQQDPTPYSLSANLKSSGSSRIVATNNVVVNLFENIVLLDQYGSSYGTAAEKSAVVANYNTAGNTVSKSVFTAGTKVYELVVLDAKTNKTVKASAFQTATAGTYEFVANLYYDEDGSTTTKDAKLLSSKTFSVYVANTEYSSYTAELKSADKLLYAGANSAGDDSTDKETIIVKAKDSNGEVVTLPASAYKVALADNPAGAANPNTKNTFKVDGNGVISVVAGEGHVYNKANGAVKGNLIANVYTSDGTVKLTSVEVPYDNSPSVTSKYEAKAGDTTINLQKGIELDAGLGCYKFVDDFCGCKLLIDRHNAAASIAADVEIVGVDQYGLSNFGGTVGVAALSTSATNFTKNVTISLDGSLKQDFNVIWTAVAP